jgi:hypothetical protein
MMRWTRPGPRSVSDTERIYNLPTWAPEDFKDLDLTVRFKTPAGAMMLRPQQSVALHFIERCRGLVGSIGVGGGKGLITMLAPEVLRAQRPVLLLPPDLVETFRREYRKFRGHFKLSKNLKVISYSELSVASGADLLNRIRPDLIIGDEAHKLRYRKSARTRRVLRYFEDNPDTVAVWLSGTITNSSLVDYSHLCLTALRTKSPVPVKEQELQAWANCVDAKGKPCETDWQTFRLFLPEWESLDPLPRKVQARDRYLRRFRSSPGVVSASVDEIGTALYFRERHVEAPPEVQEALRNLNSTWSRPDGEEFEDALSKYRVESQVSSGFYYRWVWPGGEPDKEWIEKRAVWHRCIRAVLERGDPQFDSPLRVAQGVAQGTLKDLRAKVAWDAWCTVKHRPAPPTETVWLSNFLVEDAITWALEVLGRKERGIIWYAYSALGNALRAAGLQVFGPGTTAEDATDPVVGCSIAAQGTGKNLQYKFFRNYFLNWPTSGSAAEQAVGRTHRPGQPEDDVGVYYLEHTESAKAALVKSMEESQYIEQTQGVKQKMVYGTWENKTWAT